MAEMQMKMIGNDETPRGQFCALLFHDLLLRLVAKTGEVPEGAYLAFQWPDGTKILIAAKDADAAANLQAGVYKELQDAFELGFSKMTEGNGQKT